MGNFLSSSNLAWEQLGWRPRDDQYNHTTRQFTALQNDHATPRRPRDDQTATRTKTPHHPHCYYVEGREWVGVSHPRHELTKCGGVSKRKW
ncbi:hypothetical protein E2C01_059107 [Portunus trituberculatus]|uniref:Uncharacterized protein n=1 Tax=Portunus trituberculatus TaxID=210409 RepID=A0A5B7H865_PORTR|nr:hypothetical protein [Portunus trituberculatus]